MHVGTDGDYPSQPHHGNQYTEHHGNQYTDSLVTPESALFDVPPLQRSRVQGTPITGGQRSEITPWHESGIINSEINGLRYVIQPAYQQTTVGQGYSLAQGQGHSPDYEQYALSTDLDYVTSDNLDYIPGLHSTELLQHNISNNQVPYDINPSEITSDISLSDWETGSGISIWINSTEYGNISRINGTSEDNKALDILGDVTLGIVLGLMCMATFVGNAMVLHAVRTEKRLQTVRHFSYSVLYEYLRQLLS